MSDEMTLVERALVSAVRLGMSGDKASLELHARNLARKRTEPVVSDECRRRLVELVGIGDVLR